MCDTKMKQLRDCCDVKIKSRLSASPNWFEALYLSSLAHNLRMGRGKSRASCIWPNTIRSHYETLL